MRLLAWLGGALVLGVGAALLWFHTMPPTPIAARWGPEDCRRIGPEIVGAEDMAVLADGTLVASAYGRLAGPDESGRPPDGNLWAVSEDGLTPLVEPATLSGGFRPHGIAATPWGLAVINRGFVETADGWQPQTSIDLLDASARPIRRIETHTVDSYCAANDLAASEGALLVTLDRAGCEAGTLGRFRAGDGRVLTHPLPTAPPEIVAEGLAFANGIVVQDGTWWVAETRANRISGPEGSIALPGGPDNLTVDGAGIVAALHPSILRLALNRYGLAPRAPSRVVRIEGGAVEGLFDDPTGEVFSAATVGQMHAGRLYIGSVTDRGILVCGDGV
ncbi:MAG: hypothetical protein AAGE18_08620 [Pseudomonadota bacterium]